VPRPDSACTTSGLPELATAASPVAPSTRLQQQQQCSRHARLAANAANAHEQQQGVGSAADLQQQQEEAGRQDSNAAQMSDWHVQLLQQQAQLDLLKLRLSQQQKQQRLHNTSSGLSSRQQQQSPLPSGSSSVLAGHNNLGAAAAGGAYSGSGTAAAGSGRTSLAAAAAAGAAAGNSAAAALPWQLPDSPLVPAAGGSSPLTLQQRRQQQQQHAAARGATDAGRWGHTNGISRFDQQQGPLLQTAAAEAGMQGSRISPGRGLDRQQQQQQKPLLATVDGRYDADSSWATPDKASRGPALSPAAEKSDWLLDRLDRNYAGSGTQGYQQAAGVSASGSSSGSQAAGGAGSSSSSSGGGSTPAGASLVALGNDVMGALSLSQFHRERSKQQEARAKQHAQNAQDALDRAAAVRGSRLSNASPQLGLGAAGGGSLLPRLSTFDSSSR
jgi:hypothetical protein